MWVIRKRRSSEDLTTAGTSPVQIEDLLTGWDQLLRRVDASELSPPRYCRKKSWWSRLLRDVPESAVGSNFKFYQNGQLNYAVSEKESAVYFWKER